MTGTFKTAYIAFVGLSLSGYCHGQHAQSTVNPDSFKQRVQAVYDQVGPAIVQFGYGDKRPLQFGCGVIVTAEGHIAVSGPVHAVIDDDLLELRLADGRRVPGKALGWSSEYGVGLLKITEDGPWPHVDIRETVKAGELCVALAYPRQEGPVSAPQLVAFSGVVTQSDVGQWLTGSYRVDAGAYGVFDLHGKLLGLNSKTPVGGDPIHLSAALIKTHWDDLVAGKNLDRIRLYPEEPEPSHGDDHSLTPEAVEISAAVIEAAEAASVQINDVDEDKGLASGVIVTADGMVMTCGHHDRLPGHQVKLSLRDGRRADGVVVGNNRLADIGLVKITNDGPWPHAELGRSATLQDGDPCVMIGYPNARPGRDPWIRQTRIVSPTLTLPRKDDWYYQFWTSGFPHSLTGTSGGGVFDQHGKVIGVLIGGPLMAKEEDGEMKHVRVELFQKQWSRLAAAPAVDVVDTSFLSEIRPLCEKIDKDLLMDGQE